MNLENINLDRIIDDLREGRMTKQGLADFEKWLLEDAELRKEFRARMRLEANLHYQLQAAPEEMHPLLQQDSTHSQSRAVPSLVAVAAAVALALLITLWPGGNQDAEAIASIESSQNAVWAEPVTEALAPGKLRLLSGLATLRFKSGVVVDLEAPSSLVLISPMRCRLSDGKAVFEVPESAHGFVVETPEGHAVDHGTQFAVTVSSDDGHAEFGVMEGSISVFHTAANDSKTLFSGDLVSVSHRGISNRSVATIDRGQLDRLRIYRTNGREDSIIRDNQRGEFLDPCFLMVKRDLPVVLDDDNLPKSEFPKDRRALFGFEIGAADHERIHHARLKLNLVSTGSGYAKFTPEVTTFQVYGVRDDEQLEAWRKAELQWQDAPGSEGTSSAIKQSELVLLGEFELSRNMLEGQVVFESPDLDRFVHTDSTGIVDFLIATQTLPMRSWSRVHGFASSLHSTVSGPTLELELNP